MSTTRLRFAFGGVAVLVATTLVPPGAASARTPAPPTDPSSTSPARLFLRSTLLGSYDSTASQGGSIALSADGRTLALGAPARVSRGSAGHVYVFVNDGPRWRFQARLDQPGPGLNRRWAEVVALSADGSELAIGDPGAARSVSDPTGTGVVTVLRRTGQRWEHTLDLAEPVPQANDDFGAALSLSADGQVLVVGSPLRRGPETPSLGAVWRFSLDAAGAAQPTQELRTPTGIRSNGFGSAVALSGDGRVVVVGSPYATVAGAAAAGQAFVYAEGAAGLMVLKQALSARRVTASGGFGASVAVSYTGSTVVAGEPFEFLPTATVFERQGSYWARTATFVASADHQGWFGFSVCVSASGADVVVGAPFRTADHGTTAAAGGAYRYVRRTDGWRWGGPLFVASARAFEQVGLSTAISGDGRTAVLGAPRYSPTRSDENVTGAAYVFTG